MINLSSSGLFSPAVKTISSGSFPELLMVGSWVLGGLHCYFSVISRYIENPMEYLWVKKIS